MTTIAPSFQGRFGNQCLQWLFCYGFALRHKMKFECPEWIGERVFDLPKYDRPSLVPRQRKNEVELVSIGARDFVLPPPREIVDTEFRGYAQMQICADYYTKRQAQSWLKLRSDVAATCLMGLPKLTLPVVCHERRGDYFGYNYPVVSRVSYLYAMREYGLTGPPALFLSDDHPTPPEPGELSDELSFMPDFYRMMTAPTLLRGNSTFSWLAALLGNGLVLSPVIDGLEGGKEHDVKFVAGNHPRLANFDFTTEMLVNP